MERGYGPYGLDRGLWVLNNDNDNHNHNHNHNHNIDLLKETLSASSGIPHITRLIPLKTP